MPHHTEARSTNFTRVAIPRWPARQGHCRPSDTQRHVRERATLRIAETAPRLCYPQANASGRESCVLAMTRLDELINSFLDDRLTSEERIELKRAMDVDPVGADQLLAYYQQDRLLAVLLRPSSADALNAILAAVTAEEGFVDAVMREAGAD